MKLPTSFGRMNIVEWDSMDYKNPLNLQRIQDELDKCESENNLLLVQSTFIEKSEMPDNVKLAFLISIEPRAKSLSRRIMQLRELLYSEIAKRT